jgi:hypothetical protein
MYPYPTKLVDVWQNSAAVPSYSIGGKSKAVSLNRVACDENSKAVSLYGT